MRCLPRIHRPSHIMNTATTVEDHPRIPENTASVESRKITIEGSTLAVLGGSTRLRGTG